MKRHMSVWILLAITVFVTAGCSFGFSRGAAWRPVSTMGGAVAEPQEVSLNLGDEPPEIDSARATDSISFSVLGQVAEGLVRYGEGGRVEKGSGQAADWSISEDGLTYTFKLKEGLRWSDGQPLTASDFAFAWFRALDPKTASPYNYQMFCIRGAQPWSQLDPKAADFEQQYAQLKQRVGIHVPDARTLTVQLERPTPYFLALTGFPTYFPQRQDLVARYGSHFASEANYMAYNGPFMIREWNHRGNMMLVKNPYYWDANQVRLTRIDLRMIADSATAINMFEAGQLDAVSLPGPYIRQYQGRPGFHREAASSTYYLEFNLYNPSKRYLQNIHIRRALTLGLDRQEFVRALLQEDAVPATGLVPPSIADGNGQAYRAEVGDLISAHADPTAAVRELAQGMQELGSLQLPPLEILVVQSDTAKKYAQGLQAMVQQNVPGLELTIVPVEYKVLLNRIAKGDFDIALTGWRADYNDPMTFMDLFVSGGSYNDSHWTSKQYDHYIQDAATSGDQKVRLQDFAAAEKILLDSLPIVPLYMPGVSGIRKPWFKGVLTFSVGPPFDLKWAYVEGKGS